VYAIPRTRAQCLPHCNITLVYFDIFSPKTERMTSLAVFVVAFFAGCLTGYCVRQWNRYRGTRTAAD
jgi:hypothetical protein